MGNIVGDIFGKNTQPPEPPNYTAAAQAQGAANLDTARAQGRMNNPNIVTPYGSQTVTWGTGAMQGQDAYKQAMDNYLQEIMQGNYGAARPTPEQYISYSPSDQPTITQTLSPAQQSLLDSQNRISQNLAGVAENGINRISQGLNQPFNTAQLPSAVSNVNNQNYVNGVGFTPAQTGYNRGGEIQYSNGYSTPVNNSFNAGPSARTTIGYNNPVQEQVADAGKQKTSLDSAGNIQTGFNTAGQQQTGFNQGGSIQGQLNFNNAPNLPGINDFSADRDAVTNAMLSRSEPLAARDEALARTRLTNQGLAAGSEAFNADIDALNRARNDARMQAILAGGQEQSRLFGLASQARGQYTGEQQALGNFANAAQQQQFGQGLASGNFANAAQQAQYNQNLGAMQAANAAQAQQFGQNLNAGNFANTAQQNQFNQNLNAGNFANAAQGQGFAQAQAGLNAFNQGVAQNYQQNLGQAQFQNQAQAQGFDQAQAVQNANNAAQAQANQQNLQQANFANNAYQQNFGMGQQNAALNNQTAQQLFSQGLANANLTNQLRQQAIQEQAYLRSLPLNELNALRTGAQVQNPTFQPYQGVNIAQTPIFAATQAQGQADQNIYNANTASNNSMNSGLMQVGMMAAMYF